jgi:hypothetical protein
MDNTLIYLTNKKEYEVHVRQVRQRHQEFGLYCKAGKCQFGVSEVGFLSFVNSPNGVGMESHWISTVEDRPTPKLLRDVQVILGLTNINRRTIQEYAKMTLPLKKLLKQTEASPRRKKGAPSVKWESTWQAELAFRKLTRTFAETPILEHFDPAKPIILQTYARGFGIAGILNQYDVFGVLRPVNFYTRKCPPAEQNYVTYDRELLAIVETLKQWRHYLKGGNYKVIFGAITPISNTSKHPKYCPEDEPGGRKYFRLMTLSSSTWMAARTWPMTHPDGPTTRSATKGLLHDYWQPSQWIHTKISCQQLSWPRLLTLWLSMSRQSFSTDQ